MARPTVHTEELANTICTRLAGGDSLREICLGGHGEFAIYALCEPGTDKVRYVGKSNNPKKRYNAHMTAYRSRPNIRTNRWIKSLVDLGKRPEMVTLQWVDDWDAGERFWVKVFRQNGNDLTNANDGGKSSGQMWGQPVGCPWRAERRKTPIQTAKTQMRRIITEMRRSGRDEPAVRLEAKLYEVDRAIKEVEQEMGRENGRLYMNVMMALRNPRVYGNIPEALNG